jgi:hypothetical protein
MEASCNEVVPTKSRDLWRLPSHFLIMSQSREMWRLSSGGSRGVRPGGGTHTGGSGADAGTTEQLGDTGTIPSGGAWNSWHSVHANSKGGRKATPATRPQRIGATVGSSSTRRGSPQRDSAGERSAGPTQSRGLEGSRSSPKSVPRIRQDLHPNSKPRGGAGDETRTRDIQLGRHIHESEFRIAGWRRRGTLLQLLTNRRHRARLSAAFSTAGTERPHPGGRTWHRGPTLSPAAIGWITATGRATGSAVTRRSEPESGRLRIRPRRCVLGLTTVSVRAGQAH